MENKFCLLLRGRDRAGAMRQQTYAGEDSVGVRDLTTRITFNVHAHELSPYRHTLVLDGLEYQILNVSRQ